jgi:hypothetical protein
MARAPMLTGVRGRWLPGRRSADAVLVASLALGVMVGAAVAQGRLELALVAAAGLFGVAALGELSLVAWCGLLLATTVAMRGVVTVLSLPEVLNFVHYPVTVAMAVASLQRPYRVASQAPAVWLAGLLLLTLASLLVNLSHPLRGLVFLLIVGEPLVIVWAVSRWGVSPRERRTIGWIVAALALVQFPIAAVQAAGHGFGDYVQATLTGHGAGHHVLGALFALLLLVVIAAISGRKIGVLAGVIAGASCLLMMVATGSMAITVLTALVVPLVPLLGATSRATGPTRPTLRLLPTLLAGLALGVTALILVQVFVPGIYERARAIASPERSYELALLAERVDDPGTMTFGSGPGTTSSRASLLLISAEATGSPLTFLGLDPTPEALEIAASTRSEYGGSAESASSTALGVIGDLGVLGLAGVGLLFWRMWQELGRSPNWLGPAARGALVLTGMLIFVDSWLEYPEFAVPLGLLVGTVLGEQRPTLDPAAT